MNKSFIALPLLFALPISTLAMNMKQEIAKLGTISSEKLEAFTQEQKNKDFAFCSHIRHGEIEKAKELKEKEKANPNSDIAKDILLESIIANTNSSTYMVQELLALGTNPNFIKKESFQIPLVEAVSANSYFITRALLQANASIYLSDPKKSAPIEIAIRANNVLITQLLLEYNPNEILTTLKYLEFIRRIPTPSCLAEKDYTEMTLTLEKLLRKQHLTRDDLY